VIGEGDCGEIYGMKIGKGKLKYLEKTCPSATLSATNPTWLDPGLNPGHHGGKPVTNRLSYGTARDACNYYFKHCKYQVGTAMALCFVKHFTVKSLLVLMTQFRAMYSFQILCIY
jgi:hypothetical protein